MPADRYTARPDGLLDKEISIRISPRSVLRSFILLLLLGSVFMLGRWSVSPPDGNFSGFSVSWFGSDSDEEEAPATPQATAAPAEPTAVSAPTAAAVSEPEESATPSAEANATSDAPVVTSYTKVALALSDVVTEWKGTYGKITKINYKVVNNEAGVIKPDHFVMLVEGYDDFEKKVPLPLSSKSMNPGEAKEGILNVPQGFAYSEITGGDLSSVKITLILRDSDKKTIATFTRDFKLKSQ